MYYVYYISVKRKKSCKRILQEGYTKELQRSQFNVRGDGLFHILILGGNLSEAKKIELLMRETDDNIEIIHCMNYEEAYDAVYNYNFDLFIINISPTNDCCCNGYKFAERLRAIENHKMTPIIFLADNSDIKSLAYEKIRCYKYFTKPLEPGSFIESFTDVLKFKIVPRETTLFIDERKTAFHVPHKDIVWIEAETGDREAETKNTLLYLKSSEIMKLSNYNYSIKSLEQKLKRNFIRIHRSYIVNIDFIEKFDNGYIYLTNGKVLKLGSIYAAKARERWEKC